MAARKEAGIALCKEVGKISAASGIPNRHCNSFVIVISQLIHYAIGSIWYA